MAENPQLTVTFTVTGIPDTAGLRIRSTNPTGLYISSKNPEAAKWYFETIIFKLITSLSLLPHKEGGGLHLKEELDWDAITFLGTGELTICTMSPEETRAEVKTGTPIIMSPVEDLTVNWWKNPQKNEFCIIYDPGDNMDIWLIESVTEDLKKTVLN